MTAGQINSYEELEDSGDRDLQGIPSTRALQVSLSSFQEELRVIKLDQDQLCSMSLDGTLGHFLGLVDSVSESDTNLLNLAQDEAFNASEVIDDSTDQLLRQTDQLAERMKETANKFSRRLDDIKILDANITRFSVSEVARCKDAIEEAIENITTEIQKISNDIDVANIEHSQTQTQISNLNASVNEVARRESHHKTARNAGIATSVIGGFTALGVIGLTIVCPPAGAAAAFAAGAGTSGAVTISAIAGVVASNHDDDVDTQQARRIEFNRQSEAQQDKLKRLEAEKWKRLEALNSGRSSLSSVLKVDERLVELGASFRTARSELFVIRSVFSRVQIRLRDLTGELEMCGFAETRRKLAACLNELLGSLIDQFGLDRNAVTVLQLRNGIAGMVSRTDRIQEAFRHA